MSVTGQASEGLRPSDALREAVHRFKAASLDGVRERIFTFAFKGLVYPQIWEDPEVDLKALAAEARRADGRHRIRRLQCPLLPDRRPGLDPRRRFESRARGADQIEARGDPRASVVRILLPLLRRSGRARERRRLSPFPPLAARRGDAALLGWARPPRPTPHHALQARHLSARAARHASSARRISSRACTASIREKCSRRKRSTSRGASSMPFSRRSSTGGWCAG